MNRIRVSLSLLAIATIAACAPKSPAADTTKMADPAADVAAIAKVREGYRAAFVGGDAATVASLFAADAHSMGNNLPTAIGPRAVQDATTGMYTQMSVKSFDLTSEKTEVVGDMAYDRGTFKMVVQPTAAGAPVMTDSGRYLVVLRRQADGSWKLVEEMGNSMTPLPMPPAKK